MNRSFSYYTSFFVLVFILFTFLTGCDYEVERNLSYFYELEKRMEDDSWKTSLSYTDSLSDDAIHHLDEGKDQLLLGKAYYYKGRIKSALKEDKLATDCYHRALDCLQDTGEIVIKAKVYDHLGAIYLKEGLPEKALDMFRKAYSLHLQTMDDKAIATP